MQSISQAISSLEDNLDIQIECIEKYYSHSATYQKNAADTLPVICILKCSLTDNTASTLPLQMQPNKLSNTLKELRSLALLSDKDCVRNVTEALLCICTDTSNHPLLQLYHTSPHTGWLKHKSSWIYLTSGYGIGRNGIEKNYFSDAASGYLIYDSSLREQEAYIQCMELLQEQPDELIPIFALGLLSILEPLKKNFLNFSSPGGLISGKTQTGKTELATRIARFLTDSSGNLQNFFILQDSLKNFEKNFGDIVDSTVILDDHRKSSSYTLQEKSHLIMDSIIRKSFANNSHVSLPIVTGESNTFSKMPESWKNRLVHIHLDDAEEKLETRRQVIHKLKGEQTFLFRTEYRYFIQYIAASLENHELDSIASSIEERFAKIVPRMDSCVEREYDNVLLVFWSYAIFLQYGIDLKMITSKEGDAYLNTLGENLKKILIWQTQNLPKNLTRTLFLETVKRMNIHIATCSRAMYDTTYRDCNLYCNDCTREQYCNYSYGNLPARLRVDAGQDLSEYYGHHILIDRRNHFEGVYLADSKKIYGYPSNAREHSFLIVDKEAFESSFFRQLSNLPDCYLGSKQKALYHFKAALREQHLLLGTPRHGKKGREDTLNYSLSYPPAVASSSFCLDDCMVPKKVYVFQIDAQMADNFPSAFTNITDFPDTLYTREEFEKTYTSISWCKLFRECGVLLSQLY